MSRRGYPRRREPRRSEQRTVLPSLLHSPASALWVALALVLVAGAAAGLVFYRRYSGGGPEARLEREIQEEIAAGRYHRAVPWLIEQGRIAEAARLEALRGNSDQAAKLYERAGDVRGAASVYLTMGDYQMAALVFKEAGLKAEAADAYARGGRHDTAGALFEELGELDRAAAEWGEHGDAPRRAAVLERLGRGDEAARLQAQHLESTGRYHEAAERWQAVGDTDLAIEAYKRAGEPLEAGRLMLEAGRSEAAASMLVRGGDFASAAQIYSEMGRCTQAAHAYYRAGDMSQAVRLLSEGRDWVTLARIYLQHGHASRAFATLREVDPEYARYEEAQVLLAEMYRRERKPQEAFRVYEALVQRRVDAGRSDPQVRRWVVIMAEMLFKNGKAADAIDVLRRLEDLGLMTPELEAKVREVEDRIAGPKEQLAALTSTLGMPIHDRYEFVDKLGEGGNGVIYRAKDKMLGRELAIKMIGQTALPSDLAKKFFLREAQTAAQLNHPGIVTIYDMGEIEGASYIAMELIDGESLADKLVRGTGVMDPRDAKEVVDQLCAALDYAHARGVIHRDVKLENVMVTRAGEVKLMDFGLAKAIHGSPDKSIVITGTPLYMSPEQIMGGDLDHRTDLYALGVMLYRLLAGEWPYFDGNILEAHREAPIPDPCAANPSLPEGFRVLIERTMAKVPSHRYDAAGEVAEAYHAAFPHA